MSAFRDLMMSKARTTSEYIVLSPKSMEYSNALGEQTLNVESNSSWTLKFKDNS